MKWQELNVDETLKILKSNINGLSNEEAGKRLPQFGKNEFVEEKKDGPVKLFLMQFVDILIILLIIAAVVSYFIGDTVDSIVILFVVVINAIVGFIQEYRAEKAVEKLKSLVSSEAVVIRNGEKHKIPANELTVGDVVIIEEGDNVPADLRIIESSDLRIDESALTGESLPVSKAVESFDPDENGTSKLAFMESDVVSGRGKGLVVEVGMNTSIGKIAEMIQEEEAKTPLQEKIASLGKTLGLFAMVVCSFVFVLQFLKSVPVVETFMTAVSLAVASIPEGLPAILTLTLALGMQRMARSKAIVRKLLAVETLGSCNVICTDKTGTLTKNKMTVQESHLTSPQRAFEICALCNNAHITDGKILGDPTDGALLMYAEENGYSKERLDETYHRLSEVPLDSNRKRMTTFNQINKKRYILTKGGPEILLNRCQWIEKDDDIQELTGEGRKDILNHLKKMTGNALRVLALAYRELGKDEDIKDKEDLERDLIFVGLVGLMDPPRKEAAEAVKLCKKAGIQVIMITGDHKDTASVIAKEVGLLDRGRVLTGSELNKIDDKEFENMVEEIQVYARVLPEQKVRIVEALQKKDHIVSMTGDGVNDAPALKKAAIGVSMGTGTDVARESSDMVLMDDNFATVVRAVKEGRTIFDNIRRFVKFQLSTNLGAILTVTSSSILNLPIPFNPIQILWINIIMDGPPAQSLGIEPPEKDVMERKPGRENIIPPKNLFRIIFAGVVMSVGTLALYFFELLNGVNSIKAMTIAFSVFVMFQLFNVFNCKADAGFSNRSLIIAVVASLVLQLCVVYIPAFQGVFRTTALSSIDWILIVLVASLILVSEMIFRRFFT